MASEAGGGPAGPAPAEDARPSARPDGADPASVAQLASLLGRALRALGDAGDKERACTLAAEGWALLRADHPASARRLDGVLHQLTRDRFAAGDATPSGGAQMQGGGPEPRPDVPLDVRSLAPARRHELIFETYEGLATGEAFVLINDHDPKPLYYQFAAERPGRFRWEALESGPAVWRVRIERTEPASS